MRTSIAVATTPTELAPADPSRFWLIIQNASDTDMAIDIAGSPSAALTMDNGLILAAGREVCLTGGPANNRVTAMHAGTGNKDCRVQGGSNR